jgi:hypothetical protein
VVAPPCETLWSPPGVSGSLLRYYLSGPDGLLASYGSGGASPSYLALDPHGNAVANVDSTGSVTARSSYDEFGNPEEATGSLTGQYGYQLPNRPKNLPSRSYPLIGSWLT